MSTSVFSNYIPFGFQTSVSGKEMHFPDFILKIRIRQKEECTERDVDFSEDHLFHLC